MNPRPVNVKVLDNYNLLVTFQNDEKKIFDVKPLLSMPLYQPLRNKALFKKAKADGMCLYWNDEIDICPDMLYLESHPVSGQEPAEKDQNHMTVEEVEPDEIDLQMLEAIDKDPDCHVFTKESDISW